MADDGGNDDGMTPLDMGALGILGMRGAAGAASLFRSAAPSMGRGVGMLSRASARGAGPWGLGAAAMYEIAKPTPANAGEVAQYVRGPDGQMVPNPKADRTGLQSGQAAVDMADNTLPQPSPDTPASGAPVAQQDGGDPWMGKGAGALAGDPGAMVRGTAVPDNDLSARGGKAAGVGGGSRGGVTSDSQITGRASPGSGSFLGSFGDKIKQHSNLLLGLGAGLSGKASFGQAMSGGFAGAATGNQADVTQNMTQGGIRAGYQYLVNAGVDPNQALAAVYNPELYKTLISRLNPEPKMVVTGQNPDATERHELQIGGHLVPPELARMPVPVKRFEDALRLPEGVPFSLPDGRVGIAGRKQQ